MNMPPTLGAEAREAAGAEVLLDDTIHALFAIGLRLQQLAVDSRDERLAEVLDGLIEGVDGVIGAVRAALFGLSPDGQAAGARESSG